MKRFNSEKSFTIIELLIVIFIIGILTAISFPYYRSARQQLALQRAASRLTQDLRRVQEMAMSVKRVDSSRCFVASGEPKWPDYEYGFGIYLTSGAQQKQYSLYADCNGDRRFLGQDDYKDFEIDIVDLINIESIYIGVEPPGTEYKYLNIIFIPPDPHVFLVIGDQPSGGFEVDQVSVVISAKGPPSKTKTITINKAGLITIE